MMRIKKRAYAATFTILMVLGLLAYYSNEQAKKFQVNISKEPSYVPEEKTEAPPPQPTPIPITPSSQIDSTSNTEPYIDPKIESYILTASEFKIDPSSVTVTKNKTINLVIKADRVYAGKNGLEFRGEKISTKTIKPGQTGILEFATNEPFVIEVRKKGETAILYNILVKVK